MAAGAKYARFTLVVVSMTTLAFCGLLAVRRPARAYACDAEGPCTTTAQLVQCPFSMTSGHGEFGFDIPKDAKVTRIILRDADNGTVYYDSDDSGAQTICNGTAMTVGTQRTDGPAKDTLTVGFDITNPGTGNPSEQHNVVATADWTRQSDLEVTKERVGGLDDATPLKGPIGTDSRLVVRITIKNHGPAPARDVVFQDESEESGWVHHLTKVIQDAGPNAETLKMSMFGVDGTWDRIPPGGTVTLFLLGYLERFDGRAPDEVADRASVGFAGSAKRYEPGPDPHPNVARLRIDVRESPDSEIEDVDAGGVGGDASSGPAVGGHRAIARALSVQRVRVAILHVTRGAKPFSGQLPARPSSRPGKCEWVASRRGNVAKRKADHGVCNSPIWIRATGTKHWSLRLKHRLPPGRYVVYSRATGSNGISESNFTAKDRNRRVFRVR